MLESVRANSERSQRDFTDTHIALGCKVCVQRVRYTKRLHRYPDRLRVQSVYANSERPQRDFTDTQIALSCKMCVQTVRDHRETSQISRSF